MPACNFRVHTVLCGSTCGSTNLIRAGPPGRYPRPAGSAAQVTQQAKNLQMASGKELVRMKILRWDRDSNSPRCSTQSPRRARVTQTRAGPSTEQFADRSVGTIRRERLDHIPILQRGHLTGFSSNLLNSHRPHPLLGQLGARLRTAERASDALAG